MTLAEGGDTIPSVPGDEPQAGGTAGGILEDVTRWEKETTPAGGCLHPVKLRGRIDAIDLATGELRNVYDSGSEPGGVLRTRCGNRRESVCPPCSQVYKRDARQLVRAGMTGGKGIPETIAAHPCVFATLTAPSFGPVHARRMHGRIVLPCRPRRDAKQRRCPHDRDISCPRRHGEHDPVLGRALCPDCYDYRAAVLFNAHAGELWRRFITYLPRHLARHAGLTYKAFRELAVVRYVKVAEYQARGVVHFHSFIRLDAPGDDFQPPPGWLTADMLVSAIGAAAAVVGVVIGPTQETPGCPAVTLRFGPQTDLRPVRHADRLPGTGQRLSAEAVGNYIAKYATKTLDGRARPARPSAPLPGGHQRGTVQPALQAADARRLAPGRTGLRPGRPLQPVGTHARLRRPLPHQIPPLLNRLRPAPPCPRRPPARHPPPRRRNRPMGPPAR